MLFSIRNLIIMVGGAILLGAHARAAALPTAGDQTPTVPHPGSFVKHQPRAIGAQERFVGFQTCSPSMGLVHSIAVRSHDARSTLEVSPDASVVFRSGRIYDITIIFTSPVKALRPRAALIASKVEPGSLSHPISYSDHSGDSYAYSGQSFDGCKYTSCPVRAQTLSTYTYQFQTLHSSFSWLTFNVSRTFQGPSLFCVGFPVTFIDEESEAPFSEEDFEPDMALEPHSGEPIFDLNRMVGGGESGGNGGFELVLQKA